MDRPAFAPSLVTLSDGKAPTPAGLPLVHTEPKPIGVGDQVIFETDDEYIEGEVLSISSNTWFISLLVTGGTCSLPMVLVCDFEYQYLRHAPV